MTSALIVGVDGQDGSYLAEFLLDKGYQVTGWSPAVRAVSFDNLSHILDRLNIVRGDLTDQDSLLSCIENCQPDEIYNLAAPSAPQASWNSPVLVGEIAALGVTRLLEAVRRVRLQARFFQASSSEIFGLPQGTPQSENTPFQPRNPYGIAKLYAHWMVARYREYHGLFAISGILFNHESPRRPVDFVTRKITRRAVQIKLKQEQQLRLGNLDARRDWGFAGDTVRGMWLMLQHGIPQDYVLGTGETHSVREICELAFGSLDLDYREYVLQDPALFRPAETVQLVADPGKIRRELGWEPQISFQQLIRMMVAADLAALSDK